MMYDMYDELGKTPRMEDRYGPIFDREFLRAQAEADTAYQFAYVATGSHEAAHLAYKERMNEFGREMERKHSPLLYAVRLLATRSPDDWREYLGNSYAHHDDRNAMIYLAGEAANEPLSDYDEPFAMSYWQFLRHVRVNCPATEVVRKEASELLGIEDAMGRSRNIAAQEDRLDAAERSREATIRW